MYIPRGVEGVVLTLETGFETTVTTVSVYGTHIYLTCLKFLSLST
jgi:hypothetical protein